jgi:predicted enzyme related to lactoylglutathione lyase
MENAVDFYGTTLGLKKVEQNNAGYVFESDGCGLIGLHLSTTAGSGQATCAWWTVDDIEKTVKDMKKRGIVFEQNYDLPHVEQKNDIYILSDDHKAAWFRDIDGNILGIGNF